MKHCVLSVYNLDGELIGHYPAPAEWADDRITGYTVNFGMVHLVYSSEVFYIERS